MKNKISLLLAFLIFLVGIQISCSTSRKTKGAIIGTVIGGTTAAILTKDNKAVGIILGAAIGGVAGGVIGAYMDKQAEDIADDLGEYATVSRVGEGIVVSFDSGLLFDFDSYDLKNSTRSNLELLAGSLHEYEKTNVNILGHTDSVGSTDYNQELSEVRAESVKNYLMSLDISRSRMIVRGYGETDPVATNKTDEGRRLNRRVEIVIVANEDLKADAQNGTLSLN